MLYETIAVFDRIPFSSHTVSSDTAPGDTVSGDTVSGDTVADFSCAKNAQPRSRAPDTPSSTR